MPGARSVPSGKLVLIWTGKALQLDRGVRHQRPRSATKRSVVSIAWPVGHAPTGSAMHRISRSIATAIACAIAMGPGTRTVPAQATIDLENRYANVGALMVWRVDAAGKPVELRGFASGTLIRDRVMVTAGHFTAPAPSLGSLPPSIRIFASFSPA